MTDAQSTTSVDPEPAIRRSRLLRALACGLCALLVVWLTLDDPGLVWDETIYMGFGQLYLAWFDHLGHGALTTEAIEMAWGKGQVHPPLGKLGLALGIRIFHPTFPNVPALDLRSIRLASAFYFALLTGFGYWWMAAAFGPRAGLMTALVMVLTPRLFAHAHFGALDMPMAALWFVAVALFAQVERAPACAWWAAVVLGAAGLTKINAGFIPAVLVPYAVWRLRRKAVTPIAAVVIVPTAMFFLLWPHMWIAPWSNLVSYISDKASRMHVEAYYLGRAWTTCSPAWHYPIVMALVTVPVPFLAAAGAAAVRGLRRRDPTVVLLGANAGLVLLVACLPFVPKYDGVRLFLPLLPFVVCLAGRGLSDLFGYMQRRSRPAAWAVIVALFALPASELVLLHPYELSYYNAAVGGLRGAAALGFEPTYWGDAASSEVMDWLDRHCERAAKVAFFPVGSFVPSTHQRVLKDLRSDLRLVDYESGDWTYLVLVSRYGKWDDAARETQRGQRPVFSVRRRGVTLCAVYRRPSP